MQRQAKGKQALALVFVIMTLMALSTLAIAFIAISKLNYNAAANVAGQAQARLTACAAIEYAVARLEQCFGEDQWYEQRYAPNNIVPMWYYGGEDCNGDEQQNIDLENGIFEETGPQPNGLDYDISLADCLVPSFPGGQYTSNSPLTPRYYSGRKITAGTREMSYALRVRDNAQAIFLPDRLLLPAEGSTNYRGSARLLLNLIIKLNIGNPEDRLRQIAAWLENGGGLACRKKIEKDQALSPLAPYLTAYAWQNPNTIEPPNGDDVLIEAARPQYLLERWQNGIMPELVSPIRYRRIQKQPRAPININSAPKQVLFACLDELCGRAIRPGIISNKDGKSILEALVVENDLKVKETDSAKTPSYYQPASGTVTPCLDRMEPVRIDAGLAEFVVAKIVKRRHRKPFNGWLDFARFLAALIDRQLAPEEAAMIGTGDQHLTPEQAALIWANANPNTNLNKFNPDFPDSYLYALWSHPEQYAKKLFYRLDKSDLITYTTEFCFFPTGYFAIEALARITDQHGDLLAREETACQIKLFDILHHTTQAHFCQGAAQNLASYPEADSAAAAVCHYDGWLAPTPRQTAMSTWNNIAPGRLLGDNPGNCFRDGVFSDANHAMTHDNSFNDQDNTKLVYFWYKPNWNILDPWARPHSIINANGSQPRLLFQVYNESKVLSPQLSDNACWSIFVWDNNEKDGGSPVKLTLTLPPDLAQNRWLFFALYWNRQKMGVIVNDERKELGQNLSFPHWLIFPTHQPEAGKTYKTVCVTFMMRNPSLQPFHSGKAQCLQASFVNSKEGSSIGGGGCYYVDGDENNRQGFTPHQISAILLFQDCARDSANKLLNFQTPYPKQRAMVGNSDICGRIDANGNMTGQLLDGAGRKLYINDSEVAAELTLHDGQNAQNQRQQLWPLLMAYLEDSRSTNDIIQEHLQPNDARKQKFLSLLGTWGAADKEKIKETLIEYLKNPDGAYMRIHEHSGRIESFWFTFDYQFQFTPKAKQFALGGELKYLDFAKANPEPQLLSCPSNGSYGLLSFQELGKIEDAQSKAEEIYRSGRYLCANSDYVSNDLALPARPYLRLGAVRWTAYHPQDIHLLSYDRKIEFQGIPAGADTHQVVDIEQNVREAPVHIEVAVSVTDKTGKLLTDSAGNPLTKTFWSKSFGDGSTKALDLAIGPESVTGHAVRYRLRFMKQTTEGKDYPVLSAPMIDDLTITYSNGCRFLTR